MSREAGTDVLFDTFFASCPEMLFIARADGGLLRWSAALRRALGPGIEQSRPLAELTHPEDRGAFEAAWARLGESEQAVQVEARFLVAGGEYRALTWHASRSAAGDTVHGSLRPAAAGGTSASARRRLKERLLDTLADNINICLWAVETDGTVIYQEGKGLALAGLKPGQLLGVNLFELEAFAQDMPALKKALDGNLMEYSRYQEHGDIFWQSWMVPIPGDRGVEMVLGLTVDVSDGERAQRSLHDQIRQIEQQQEVIRRLSTPIIEVWEGVLTLPMVGVIDSIRTAEVMDNLLSRVADQQARFAILDLTGVEVVDTQVAMHLIQLLTAIQLLGAEGIVAGIKSNVAQTMVALGLDLSQLCTHRNLRTALIYAIRRMNAQKLSAPRA